MGSTSIYPSVPCVNTLGIARYISYQQLVDTLVQTDNANHVYNLIRRRVCILFANALYLCKHTIDSNILPFTSTLFLYIFYKDQTFCQHFPCACKYFIPN